MAFGLGIILATAGAILAWGVSAEAEGVNLNTVGLILLIAGAATVVLSLLVWSTWAGPGYFSRSRREKTVERDADGRHEVVREAHDVR